MVDPAVDAVVVGGGMVGLAAAAGLADAGLRIAVIEGREPVAWCRTHVSNRVSAVTPASRRLLQRLGAWETIEQARVSPFEAIRAWSAPGHAGVTFDAAERGEPCLGHIIENTLIQEALRGALADRSGVTLYCPAQLERLECGAEGATVALADGRRLRTRLVVGADGARSRVRAGAAIGVDEHAYGQRGIVATVATERPHGAIARQRFLPTGPLALLPLADGRCSLVWSVDEARGRELEAMNDTAFNEALAEASEGVLGAVTASDDRASFPLARLHAHTYVAPRVALVGDAAHVIHPLAGQGVNLGFLDAAALADVVACAGRAGRDPGGIGVLRRYARWRRGDNALMLRAMDGFQWLFSNDHPVRSAIRNAGLAVTDHLPPLKGVFMEHALGRRSDLPSLARP